MVEIVRDHADLFALGDATPVEHAVGIHAGRVHVHVAEADVLVAGVDLQRRRLLLRRADHDAVADGDDALLLGIAVFGPSPLRRTGAGADILALVAKAAGALSDFETAGFAEIVPPRIAARRTRRIWRAWRRLRVDEGRRLFQRKADLRIGGEVGMAALFVRAAVGDDVAARTIAEIGRRRSRPFGKIGGNVGARPRRQAAGDAQRFQETLGDRIGLAAGQPPRARRRVQALDRHHIGHAEAGEGIAHIAFADEAAQVGKLRRQRLDRFALAAEGIGEIVGQDRAGDLNFDRPDQRSAAACRRRRRVRARTWRRNRPDRRRTGRRGGSRPGSAIPRDCRARRRRARRDRLRYRTAAAPAPGCARSRRRSARSPRSVAPAPASNADPRPVPGAGRRT